MTTVGMTIEQDPDAVLMLRVKDGDMTALETLVDRYKQPVISLVCRSLGDLSEAEDVAQNVFIQVFKSASRYQVTAKFSTWLFTIARNLCLNELRRRKRHPNQSLDALLDETEENQPRQYEDMAALPPTELALQQELTAKIEEALSALPENQRTAILLFREKEMSYEEIASIMGNTVSATKSLIHRGRETLKGRLKPFLKTGNWE